MQLDSAGNPIVLGTTSNSLAKLTNNMTVAKYDPKGNLLWAKDFSAVANESQTPGGLAIDASDSVYATGATNPPEGLDLPFTVKYDNNGNLVCAEREWGWRHFGGSRSLLKYFAEGASRQFWHHNQHFRLENSSFGGSNLAHTDRGNGEGRLRFRRNVFIAGSNYLITKLTPKGKQIFETRFTPGNEVTDAVVDPSGNLLVTGTGVNAIFEDDIFTLRIK